MEVDKIKTAITAARTTINESIEACIKARNFTPLRRLTTVDAKLEGAIEALTRERKKERKSRSEKKGAAK